MAQFEFIEYQENGATATVWLSRPPANAVNQSMYAEIKEFFDNVDEHLPQARVLVLAGRGRHFCGGNDLEEFKTLDPENSPGRMKEVREAFFSIYDSTKPVIAAVQGAAVGTGLAIAASCDLVVAAESARFGLPEVNVGVMGGAKHLSRMVPQGVVRLMHLSGDLMPASKLLPYGGIVDVVPDEKLYETAQSLAESLARHSPAALRFAKQSLNAIEYMDLKSGYEYEQSLTAELSGYEDSKEALNAFLERRTPVYTGAVTVVSMVDLRTYRAQARQWLDAADVPHVPLDLDERFAVLRDWQRTLFDAGWIGIDWSREAGGQGLTPMHQLVFAEELARARAPMPIGLIGLDVVGPSIDHHGQSWQREELLPMLLSGEHIWCQGFSEPDAGSDLASLRTRAVIEGDDFVISGQKVWTSWAHKAQWCALLVRTDPGAHKNAGISYVLVDMSSPGITARPLEQMTGDREFCEVFFDEVRVPRRNLVGELNQGWTVATHTLGIERAAYTVRRRVDYEVAFEDAVAALREGDVPGPETALGRRVRVALGRAQIALRVLGAQTRRTVKRLDAGEVPTSEDSVDKLLLNGIEQTVFSSIVELLGPSRALSGSTPLGLEADRWVHDHLYSRSASIYGGTSQVQRNIISERLLGLPRG